MFPCGRLRLAECFAAALRGVVMQRPKVRHHKLTSPQQNRTEPATDRIQALADISRSAPYCHSNETRAPIANPPTSAQLEGTSTIPPSYNLVRVGRRQRTNRQTQTDT